MAVLSEASLVAGHSGRLLHPDVWKLHAAHVLLRLLARLHLGEFNPGARRSIAAVSLVAFSRPPGNRSGQASIFSRVQSRRCQMGTSSTETPRVLRSDAIFPTHGPSPPPPPQVVQALAWVVSTVLLKSLLSTVLCASDDVRDRLRAREGRSRRSLF